MATGTSAITVSVASAEDIVITLQLVVIVSRYFKRKGAGANYNLGGHGTARQERVTLLSQVCECAKEALALLSKRTTKHNET